MISVEPYPDDSTAPFALKPLTGAVPSPAVTGAANSNPLAFNPDSLGGTVTIATDTTPVDGEDTGDKGTEEPELAFTGTTTNAIVGLGVGLVALGAVAVRRPHHLGSEF